MELALLPFLMVSTPLPGGFPQGFQQGFSGVGLLVHSTQQPEEVPSPFLAPSSSLKQRVGRMGSVSTQVGGYVRSSLFLGWGKSGKGMN